MIAGLTKPFRFAPMPQEAPREATGGEPPRRRTGPVMMGDIHGQIAGTPTLLLLWRRWEEDAGGE